MLELLPFQPRAKTPERTCTSTSARKRETMVNPQPHRARKQSRNSLHLGTSLHARDGLSFAFSVWSPASFAASIPPHVGLVHGRQVEAAGWLLLEDRAAPELVVAVEGVCLQGGLANKRWACALLVASCTRVLQASGLSRLRLLRWRRDEDVFHHASAALAAGLADLPVRVQGVPRLVHSALHGGRLLGAAGPRSEVWRQDLLRQAAAAADLLEEVHDVRWVHEGVEAHR
mmetsp:Transcript_90571/g.251836  ORF Transcript_90571/g.251836 Transcript_90571/m.251836 type:complete len:230 (+) Transcript_90571:99-788(+)